MEQLEKPVGVAPRPSQPWPIRLTHWINVIALVSMAGSGLRILTAYPFLGPRGEDYAWYPFQGTTAPSWMTIGAGLAGARSFHFAWAWVLMANAAVYLVYLMATGEWRRRAFFWGRDLRNAVEMVAYYLRIRKTAPATDFYNGLQRAAYTGVVPLLMLQVLSGLVMYKPVQLSAVAPLFGGYDGARAVHLMCLFALTLFTLGHVVMVASHPRTFLDMITGGKRG